MDRLRRVIWHAAARLAGVPAAEPKHKMVILTHDLDQRMGIPGIETIRKAERDFGVRSAWGVLSKRYELEAGIIHALLRDDCEIFSHGYLHDGLLPYLDRASVRMRLSHFFDVYPFLRGKTVGFRCGQLTRSDALYEHLTEFFAYDLTPPTSERFGPYGANSGCGTAHPFLTPEGLVHVPLSLPQDFYLAYVMGFDKAGVADCWKQTTTQVWAEGGIALLNLHPDNVVRTPWLAQSYRDYLEFLADRGATVLTPAEALTQHYGGWLPQAERFHRSG